MYYFEQKRILMLIDVSLYIYHSPLYIFYINIHVKVGTNQISEVLEVFVI